VSTIRASAAGNSTMRESGALANSAPVGAEWVATTHPPISQSQCWQPLAKAHRPLTRYPPGTSTACPTGAKTPPLTAPGAP
jgi:hypothetical protein